MRVLGCIGVCGAVVFSSGCETDGGGKLLEPLLFSSPDSAARYGEPNDTIEQAVAVPTNDTPVPSAFHRLKDLDYYRFLAAQGATYIVRTLDLEPGVLTNLELRDRDDKPVTPDTVGSTAPGAMRVVWKARFAGYLYVRVSSVEGGRVGTYKLRISVGPDGYEPDNSISTARMIAISGDPQQHTLHERTDVDYVEFAGWSDFAYHIRVEVADMAGNVSLSVVDATGNALATNAAPPYESITVTVPNDGFYFASVAAKNDQALGTYNISVTPASDPWEPDSTLALAKPISTDGAPQRHSFSSSADQDYIRFEAQAGRLYSIRTDSLSSGVDTQIELNSVAGTALDSNDDWASGKESGLTWTSALSAPYYVRIRSSGVGKPGHYVVSVKG